MSYKITTEEKNKIHDRFLKKLMSDDTDAISLRAWLDTVKYNKHGMFHYGFLIGDDLNELQNKIYTIANLSFFVEPVSGWDKLNKERKKRHKHKVVENTKRLIAALSEEDRPYYPPALALFNERSVVDIARCLSEKIGESVLDSSGYSYEEPNTKEDYYRKTLKVEKDTAQSSKPPNLVPFSFSYGLAVSVACGNKYHTSNGIDYESLNSSNSQDIVSLLQNLIEYVQGISEETEATKRPNRGNPNYRIFARELHSLFKQSFEVRTSLNAYHEALASCVRLRFLDKDGVINSKNIENWLKEDVPIRPPVMIGTIVGIKGRS